MAIDRRTSPKKHNSKINKKNVLFTNRWFSFLLNDFDTFLYIDMCS